MGRAEAARRLEEAHKLLEEVVTMLTSFTTTYRYKRPPRKQAKAL